MAKGFSVFINIGARLLPSLNSAANGIERRFGQMNRRLRIQAAETRVAFKEMTASLSPLVGMAAAGGLSMSFMKAIGDSSHLAHELQMLRNAGRTSQEVAGAMASANRTMLALPTTTLIDNLKVLNETTGAFGNFQHARENLTFNQRIGSMMQNALGEKAGSPGEMFNNIVRGMEMRGAAQDTGRYQREIGELYKAMVFTGGRVNPEEFFNFAQQSNPYIKGYSQRYMTRIAPSIIQEFGGEKAGTMSNTWAGTILGKAKNKISTEAWMNLGLLDPKGVVSNKVGPVGWKPGAIKGTDLALSDPLAWSEKVLVPALRAHGFNTSDQLGLAKALMPLFRDRNANRLANVLVSDNDRSRLHKDEGLINKVPSAERAYQQTLRRDPLMAWQATKASFTNLSSVLFGTGKEDSPVAIALVHIANGVNMLAAAIERHPWLGKALGGALGMAAGLATLKVFGLGLRWIFSPLKAVGGLWRLFFSSVGKVGPRVPWITRIAAALRGLWGRLALFGRFLAPMIARVFGPAISGIVGVARLAGRAAGRVLALAFLRASALIGVAGRAVGGVLAGALSRLSAIATTAGAAAGRALGVALVRSSAIVATAGRAIGALLMRGLAVLTPMIVEGLASAFALLSNPIGWGIILAGVAAAACYYFRDDLARGWRAVVAWFSNSAWPAITATFSGIADWGSHIVDSLISGLTGAWGRVKGWFSDRWSALAPSWAGGAPAPSAVPNSALARPRPSAAGAAPKAPPLLANRAPAPVIPLAGARAKGGPVSAGKSYVVGEVGEEVFTPERSGTIIPHSELERRRAERSGGGDVHLHGDVNITEANDPAATEQAVYRALKRLAGGQAAMLSD